MLEHKSTYFLKAKFLGIQWIFEINHLCCCMLRNLYNSKIVLGNLGHEKEPISNSYRKIFNTGCI